MVNTFIDLKGVLFVEKKQAHDIITSAYHSMIDKLQQQETYDSKEIIDELHTLAQSLQSNSTQSLQLHSLEQNLEQDYKALAEESIESYAQTKESVERINQEQQRLLDQEKQKHTLKFDSLMQSFSDIQNQISTQMQEANETIEALNKKILILEKTSTLDPLTRTFNRRALDKYLGTLCELKGRTPKSTILLVDIDDFKKVNDAYGHLAGDRVLIFVAKLINSILREGDKVFRFGGEEFLILLNRCDQTSAVNIAKRVLEGVRSNTLLYKNDQIKITLSIGSAQLKEEDNYESLIQRADKALYQAKSNGKDQFVAG